MHQHEAAVAPDTGNQVSLVEDQAELDQDQGPDPWPDTKQEQQRVVVHEGGLSLYACPQVRLRLRLNDAAHSQFLFIHRCSVTIL